MQVLVDSSVWIDYFRGGTKSDDLDILIDENLILRELPVRERGDESFSKIVSFYKLSRCN